MYLAPESAMNFKNPYAFILGALLALCTLFVAGCQSDSAPLTRQEFCEGWANAACTEEVLDVCQKSQSQCRASQAESCRAWLPNDFQAVGVGDCFRAVSEAYSDADLSAEDLDIVWRLRGPCSSILVANMGGESCEHDSDCSGSAGLSCVLKDEATGTCEQSELVEPGFSCKRANQMCEPGFYCNGDNCIVAGDAGDECENDTQCGLGLYCQDEVCEEQLSVGSDCATGRQCESQICYEIDSDEHVCVNRIRLSPAEPACDGLR